MGALVFSAPIVEKIAANGPFILYPVKEPPPPEPIPTPEPRANADPMPDITVPRHVEVEVTRPDPGPLVIDIGPSTGTLTGTGLDRKHTSELQSLMRNSYAVFCLKTKNTVHHQSSQ